MRTSVREECTEKLEKPLASKLAQHNLVHPAHAKSRVEMRLAALKHFDKHKIRSLATVAALQLDHARLKCAGIHWPLVRSIWDTS